MALTVYFAAMKNVVLYVLSVGGCVAAILGLLYLGEGIPAPVSVGGAWAVEAGGACDALSLAKAVKISQSGPRLEIALDEGGRTVLHGDLEGTHVTAGSGGMRLLGDVEKDQLRGTLEVEGCSAPIEIVAVRQPPAVPKGSKH